MTESTSKTKNTVWWDGKHESFEHWKLKFESVAIKEKKTLTELVRLMKKETYLRSQKMEQVQQKNPSSRKR